METTFKTGDRLVSKVRAQGLGIGSAYVVVGVITKSTAFGAFVSYVLQPVDGGKNVVVQNGHLVLEKSDQVDGDERR